MAKGIMTVHAGKWNFSRWQKKFINHLSQDNVKIAINQVYADMSEKYVPKKTGALANSVRVTKDYVRWGGASYGVPYAHYMYTGVVYAPNYPITRNGQIVGWWSPPGEGTKHPTDRSFVFNRSKHPLAQSHWDLAVYRNELNGFKWRVTHKLKEIARREGW